MEEPDSIYSVIARVRQGDPAGEQALWDLYFERLLKLSRSRLPRSDGSERSATDVALTAFRVGLNRIRADTTAQLVDRALVWELLSLVLHDKVRKEYERRRSEKRQMLAEAASIDSDSDWRQHLVDAQPTPEEALEFAETYQRIVGKLPEKKQILISRKLELATNLEIAAEIGVAERTVERWISDIRDTFRSHYESETTT